MKDDTVSRAAVIETIKSHFRVDNDLLEVIVYEVAHLPAVQTCDDAVSRQAAINALMKRDKELRNINWYDKPYAEGECRGIDEALSIVSNLPSAQPDVIRCKNCRFQDKGSNESETWNLCGYRPWLHVPTEDEHYCGYAERRTDE